MANGGFVKQNLQPWEVNQSENKRARKVKVSWVGNNISTYLESSEINFESLGRTAATCWMERAVCRREGCAFGENQADHLHNFGSHEAGGDLLLENI